MSSVTTKRLFNAQIARFEEIERIGKWVREGPRDEMTEDVINPRLDSIKELWREIRKGHVDLVSREDAVDHPYCKENMIAVQQGNYEELRDTLVKALSDLKADHANRRRSGGPDRRDGADFRPAKLPKVELPTFSGRFEDWESFHDSFTSLVHDVARVADSTKLQYLKSCLTGPAASLVKDVSTTNANYLATWEALKERFHNPRLTITQHVKNLLSLKPIKKESSADLRCFIDEAQRIVRALSNIGMPIESWDFWFVMHLAERLDPESSKMWGNELGLLDEQSAALAREGGRNALDSLPKFKNFVKFVIRRSHTLAEAEMHTRKHGHLDSSHRPFASTSYSSASSVRRVCHASVKQPNPSVNCPVCSGPHHLTKCRKFLTKRPQDRHSEVQRLRLCFNCLGQHRVANCQNSGSCRACKRKHHTLLHTDPPAASSGSSSSGSAMSGSIAAEVTPPDAKPLHTGPVKGVSVNTAGVDSDERKVLLATARADLLGFHGATSSVRVMLDNGSQATFISEKMVQLLELPRRPIRVPLTGIGATYSGTARWEVTCTIRSIRHPNFRLAMKALVLPRLTAESSSKEVLDIDLRAFEDLELANPHFYLPGRIDLMIGADYYGLFFTGGVRQIPRSRLTALDTHLGWVVMGSVRVGSLRRAEADGAEESSEDSLIALHCSVASSSEIQNSLQKFWALEELPDVGSRMKPEDEACESIFVRTHSRDSDGRYVVKLPVSGELPRVGFETKRMAVGSLNSTHRKFVKDPELAVAYRDFMASYEALGHMTRIPPSDVLNPKAWYLPYHAVIQFTPTKKKIRVVFDASRKTQNGQCLNDFLLAGPPLQRDLSLILLNWRRFKFVFTADIVKMFRQIRVAPEDQNIQRIVWSPDVNSEPVHFRLTTVTYGTACAPYLAIRTLQQLASDERASYPLGAHSLEHCTYVDDIFEGADEFDLALKKRNEVIQLLACAGITLDKWATNHIDLLPRETANSDLGNQRDLDRDLAVKTLGVIWDPRRDRFGFCAADQASSSSSLTKRMVLSSIARLFDPLGWLSPVTVVAKILMQDLWILGSDWDTPLPPDFRERWVNYRDSFSSINEVSIDRWLGISDGSFYDLHGFSDASKRAYAAAVYIRVRDKSGRVCVTLLAAKAKVSPVKTTSIPKLELCGAVLLVRLIQHVQKLEFLAKASVHLWTDSQIVLMWLQRHPCKWETFIANRVSFIQTELTSASWGHVSTKENPADLATRGSSPSDLKTSSIWWNGPDWLSRDEAEWPGAPEAMQVLHVQRTEQEPEILSRFSSLSVLIRVMARGFRWLFNLRKRREALGPPFSFLQASELHYAKIRAISLAQKFWFTVEISLLAASKPLPNSNSLSSLNPIWDADEGILRVGGRLDRSGLSHNSKHPPILPHDSALSRLFVMYAHESCLHGGATLTAQRLIQSVWIIGRRRLVKTIIRNCVRCQRAKPQLHHQMMGNLPASRVNPSQPFAHTGLDYAGPFQVRTTKGRGHRSYKGWIALFVCFATKAIHLEVVSDMTTPVFLKAFRRFISRRGGVRHIYSDNASTFRGADAELKRMFHAASDFYKEAAKEIAARGITWTFIPSTTPHYGGLWEAGVRSVKHHLKRAFGETPLTFEEFSTILTEIEATLNSRPLCPLSGEITDLDALTPAHFLQGDAAVVLPDDELLSIKENCLSRFQLTQRIRNHFWRRWSNEYLQHLQERSKWRGPQENFAVGQLVIIRDDRYPPARWPLGRVIEVHPGRDDLVRVVTIKTAHGLYKRHVARLCPLQLEKEILPDSSDTTAPD